jgi:hypothetical protein
MYRSSLNRNIEVLMLLIMPLCLIVTMFVLRDHQGNYWEWKLLDPTYFYLFDILNILNLQMPEHLAHPGTPLYVIGAGVVKLMHPFTNSLDLTRMVLESPEHYLKAVSSAFILINAFVLFLAGYVALQVFSSPLAALTVQISPFLSKLIIKRALLVGPEILLISSTLLMMMVIMMAIRDREFLVNITRYAILFGLVAGFTGASKLTAAPLCVLPVFFLANRKAIGIYLGTGTISFVLFSLPFMAYVVSDIPGYLNYMENNAVQVSATDNPGGLFIIDHAIRAVKLLRRPVLSIPVLLSIICMFVIWRHKNRQDFTHENLEYRAIIAITMAQLIQVLVIARQPNAYYMNPSYMLGLFHLLLVCRLIWQLIPEEKRPSFITAKRTGSLLVVIGLIAGAGSVIKLDRELVERHQIAISADNEDYKSCARIYIFAASSPSYALYTGNKMAGLKFTDALANVIPKNDYWIDDMYDQENVTFFGRQGPADMKQLQQTYSCFYFRGNRPGGIRNFLTRFAPNFKIENECSTRDEVILTQGISCKN